MGQAARSPSPSSTARSRVGGAFSLREQLDAMGQQKVRLEWQVEEAARTQAVLERALSEERSRRAADREKLLVLGSRMELLERSRAANRCPSEDNRLLRSEMEAQRMQLQELQQQIKLMRIQGNRGLSPSVSCTSVPEHVQEENARLRHDLQQSRDMLSKYTGELASIMPGMQRLLLDLHPEHEMRERSSKDAPSSLEAAAATPWALMNGSGSLADVSGASGRLGRSAMGLSTVGPVPLSLAELQQAAEAAERGQEPSPPAASAAAAARAPREAPARQVRRGTSPSASSTGMAARPTPGLGARAHANSPPPTSAATLRGARPRSATKQLPQRMGGAGPRGRASSPDGARATASSGLASRSGARGS